MKVEEEVDGDGELEIDVQNDDAAAAGHSNGTSSAPPSSLKVGALQQFLTLYLCLCIQHVSSRCRKRTEEIRQIASRRAGQALLARNQEILWNKWDCLVACLVSILSGLVLVVDFSTRCCFSGNLGMNMNPLAAAFSRGGLPPIFDQHAQVSGADL